MIFDVVDLRILVHVEGPVKDVGSERGVMNVR